MKFRKETEFQETEIGKIPREWKTVKLSSIARIIMGQSPPSDTYNREGLGMPFLQGKMEFGRMYPSPTTYTTQPLKIAEPNDILISVRAPVGDVNIAPYKVCIGRGLAAIRFNLKTANHMFYFYYFQYIKKQLETLGKGSTFKAITKKDLEELLIPLPPIKEQEKVSGILTMIDRTIELYHEEREGLERLKRGLMSELLTGRIRVREENGRLSFYRETELQETEIGKIPRDWKVVKLRAISTFAKRGKTPKYGNSELLVIKTAHNYPDRIRFEEAPRASEEFQAKLPKEFYLRPEDILVNSTGTGSVGRVGFFKGYHKPCTVDGHITILRTNQSMAIPKYVFYYLASHYGQSALLSKASGSTHQVELYVNEILDLTLPLPSLEEQREIAEVLSMIDQVIELHSEGITKLERLKRGLMDLLLTGKVRVVDGDVGS
ncbi:MAG: restriction endonuclease subunit S [Thaumarchaeota archaeon]|jgi:type I restriction enzyme S subunit|nr:restriction endonuclease subunit S [Candidatus Geocrenenecus arthurdayi]